MSYHKLIAGILGWMKKSILLTQNRLWKMVHWGFHEDLKPIILHHNDDDNDNNDVNDGDNGYNNNDKNHKIL